MPSVVYNTGPILALAHIFQHDLLRLLFGSIHIPPAVRAEIQDEISVAAVTAADWITVKPVQDTLAVQLLREELDAGECEAIILAMELSADLVLIDERAAARRARGIGLPVIGTLGVLLLSKKAGHISAIKPSMDQLRVLDFHMRPELYKQVLVAADEAE